MPPALLVAVAPCGAVEVALVATVAGGAGVVPVGVPAGDPATVGRPLLSAAGSSLEAPL